MSSYNKWSPVLYPLNAVQIIPITQLKSTLGFSHCNLLPVQLPCVLLSTEDMERSFTHPLQQAWLRNEASIPGKAALCCSGRVWAQVMAIVTSSFWLGWCETASCPLTLWAERAWRCWAVSSAWSCWLPWLVCHSQSAGDRRTSFLWLWMAKRVLCPQWDNQGFPLEYLWHFWDFYPKYLGAGTLLLDTGRPCPAEGHPCFCGQCEHIHNTRRAQK